METSLCILFSFSQKQFTLFKLFSNQLYGILKKSNSDKEAKKERYGQFERYTLVKELHQDEINERVRAFT